MPPLKTTQHLSLKRLHALLSHLDFVPRASAPGTLSGTIAGHRFTFAVKPYTIFISADSPSSLPPHRKAELWEKLNAWNREEPRPQAELLTDPRGRLGVRTSYRLHHPETAETQLLAPLAAALDRFRVLFLKLYQDFGLNPDGAQQLKESWSASFTADSAPLPSATIERVFACLDRKHAPPVLDECPLARLNAVLEACNADCTLEGSSVRMKLRCDQLGTHELRLSISPPPHRLQVTVRGGPGLLCDVDSGLEIADQTNYLNRINHGSPTAYHGTAEHDGCRIAGRFSADLSLGASDDDLARLLGVLLHRSRYFLATLRTLQPERDSSVFQPKRLSRARVLRALDNKRVRYFQGSDGVLGAFVDHDRFDFEFSPDHLDVHGYWHLSLKAEYRDRLQRKLNTLNDEFLCVKSCTSERAGGRISVRTTVPINYPHGANDLQLRQQLQCAFVSTREVFTELIHVFEG